MYIVSSVVRRYAVHFAVHTAVHFFRHRVYKTEFVFPLDFQVGEICPIKRNRIEAFRIRQIDLKHPIAPRIRIEYKMSAKEYFYFRSRFIKSDPHVARQRLAVYADELVSQRTRVGRHIEFDFDFDIIVFFIFTFDFRNVKQSALVAHAHTAVRACTLALSRVL